MRRDFLKNRKLVTKRDALHLYGSTGTKTGAYESEKGDEKRAHPGSKHDVTNDRNLGVCGPDEVFGNHRRPTEFLAVRGIIQLSYPLIRRPSLMPSIDAR
jgi:hypothetical protein